MNLREKYQEGAATLLMVIILTFSSTMLVLYTAKVGIDEQKIAASEYRLVLSGDSSEAGLQYAVSVLQDSNSAKVLLNDSNDDGWLADESTNTISKTLNNGDQSFLVTLTNPTINDFSIIEAESIGCSDGCSPCSNACPSRNVTKELVGIQPTLINPPPSPMVSLGDVKIKGSVDFSGNEGSPSIKAGGDVTTPGKTKPGEVAAQDADYKDLTEDEFFQLFFGLTKTQIKSQATIVSCTSTSDCNTKLGDPALAGEVVWVDGDAHVSKDTVLGSADEPMLLIVDGNLQVSGSVEIFGVSYSTGDIKYSGQGNNLGAGVAEGTLSATGNTNFSYSPEIVKKLQSNAVASRIAGSWID